MRAGKGGIELRGLALPQHLSHREDVRERFLLELTHGAMRRIDGGGHECAIEGHCQVKPHLHAVNGAVRGALAGVSLASLASSPAHPEPVEGLPFSSRPEREGQGFDKLSLSGVGTERISS